MLQRQLRRAKVSADDYNYIMHTVPCGQFCYCIQQRRVNTSSIYNLEEEKLTHLGQSIGEMESFNELQLSSDDDNQSKQNSCRSKHCIRIDSTVDDTETHFGGFLKKKFKEEVGSAHNSSGRAEKTRKEAIEEIVAKSKLYKVMDLSC